MLLKQSNSVIIPSIKHIILNMKLVPVYFAHKEQNKIEE